jgi:hypothetical protein
MSGCLNHVWIQYMQASCEALSYVDPGCEVVYMGTRASPLIQ